MFLKTNERGEKNKITGTELKSRENSKGKPSKREFMEYNEYETDQKRNLNQSQQSLEEMKEIMSNCNHCKAKISQFVTKKPSHIQEKAVQTVHKPFLIDLIEERVENICRQNTKLNRIIEEREEELLERQQEINEIEDKFTTILLHLSQEIAFRRRKGQEWHELKRSIANDSDTPAYLKALHFEN
jgi:hypothetical protein